MARRALGFTLVELLVALTVLSVLALMSWRGIDSMLDSQARVRQHTDTLAVLQTALAQWRTDLDTQLPATLLHGTLPAALDWDGRVLRIVRQAPAGSPDSGVVVAAWSRRAHQGSPTWLRWQSPVLRTRSELLDAWGRAAQWSQNPGDADQRLETALLAVENWQIFYFRGGAWSHPLSSDGNNPPGGGAPSAAPQTPPDGVRLTLTLPGGQALTGTLQLDWVRPNYAEPKS